MRFYASSFPSPAIRLPVGRMSSQLSIFIEGGRYSFFPMHSLTGFGGLPSRYSAPQA